MSDQLYRQQIIEHYKNPHNVGDLPDATNKARVANTSCGDEVEVFLKFNNDKLEDIKYEARGCAVSIAAASLLSDEIKGMTKAGILELNNDFMEELIGAQLTTSRVKCATLGLDAIKKAIQNS